jgi:hypothetical protein
MRRRAVSPLAKMGGEVEDAARQRRQATSIGEFHQK